MGSLIAFAEAPLLCQLWSQEDFAMRSWIWITFVASLATLGLLSVGLAKVPTSCPTLDQPCECAWPVRDCLPRCHLQPRLECPRFRSRQHEEITP